MSICINISKHGIDHMSISRININIEKGEENSLEVLIKRKKVYSQERLNQQMLKGIRIQVDTKEMGHTLI